MSELQLIEAAFSKFAKDAFDDDIFYNDNTGIRLRISGSGSPKKIARTTYDTISNIAEDLFRDSLTLNACLSFYGSNYLSNLNSFKQLKDYGIKVPKNHQLFSEQKDNGTQRNCIFFEFKKQDLHKFIWMVAASNSGREPYNFFGLYLFDISQGVLMHPFGSDGIDIVGGNRYKIKSIYTKYNSLLPPNGLAKMDNYYKYM
jgi:hypothetical protein